MSNIEKEEKVIFSFGDTDLETAKTISIEAKKLSSEAEDSISNYFKYIESL